MLLLLVLACAGKGDDTGPVDDSVRIRIVSPAAGEAVPTCFTTTVEVQNFTIVSYLDHPEPVDGEGHWLLDFGERAFYCEAVDCGTDLSGMDAGEVTLRAVLVGNDHAPVLDDAGAEVADEVAVSYVPEACGVEE